MTGIVGDKLAYEVNPTRSADVVPIRRLILRFGFESGQGGAHYKESACVRIQEIQRVEPVCTTA